MWSVDASLLSSLAVHGFAILPPVGENLVTALQAEAEALLEQAEADAGAAASSAVHAATSRGCVFQLLPKLHATHPARTSAQLYWNLRSKWPCQPAVAQFLQSPALLQLLQACLGCSQVMLYNEQYIIKPPNSAASSAFAWHYDSEYASSTGRQASYSPYLSLWVALDDMTSYNGCLVIMPGYMAAAGCNLCCQKLQHKAARAPVAAGMQQHAGDATLAHDALRSDSGAPGLGCGGCTSTAGLSKQHPCCCAGMEAGRQPAGHRGCAGNTCSSVVCQQQQAADVCYMAVSSTEELLQLLSQQEHLHNAVPSLLFHQQQQPPTVLTTHSVHAPVSTDTCQRCCCCTGITGTESRRPIGLLLPAGAAVLFWDNVWHCSAANMSQHTRTAYMAQFSSEPVTWEGTEEPVGLAVGLQA